MLSEEYISKYYNFIKEKAQQYLVETSCFNQDSKGKGKFFATLDSKELIDQLLNLQNFFRMALEVKIH